MNSNKRLLAVVLISSGMFSVAAQGAVEIKLNGMAQDEWIDPFYPVTISLSQVARPQRARLAFFIGVNDVSGLMKNIAPGVYQYRASLSPLPAGEQELKVYLVRDDNQWDELAVLPLRVLTEKGFESSEVSPQLSVSDAWQRNKATSDFEPDGVTETSNEVTLQGGLNTRQRRSGVEIASNWNISGSSRVEQALRFAEKGDDAPRIDLSDYLIEVTTDTTSFQLGHVSYGANPLLMDNVANRGVVASWRASERVDVSFSAQNGQSISGAANLTGLNRFDRNGIAGMALGVDLMPESAAALRVELTLLDATITAEDNFNIGEVSDAQKSRGLGVLLRGNNESGRLRGEMAIARSTFSNPSDPFLEQDVAVVQSTETTDLSRLMKLEYDVLQADYEDEASAPWTMAASLTHQRTDPFYQSVGAFVTPDTEQNTLALQGQAGEVSWQLQYSQARDNLDDIASVLTTINRNTTLSVSIPLNSDSAWLPQSISIDYQKNHQFGDNLPSSFDPDSHVPDQITLQQSLALEWQIEQTSLSFQFSKSDQDNRQPGRDNADFINTEQSLSVNTQLADNINLSLSYSHSEADDKEQDLIRQSNNISTSLDWALSQQLALSLNLSDSRDDDSQNLASSDGQSVQAQLSYRFELPGGAAGKLPLQLFVRYSKDDNATVDNQFNETSKTANQAINAGLNIRFF